jgi:nucleotide-binding universal stress UspA family protein
MSRTPDNRFEDAALPIVVGVDGSDCSIAALRWAAEQARITSHKLRAVTTWEWPNLYGDAVIWPADMSLEESAKDILRESVEKVLGADGADGVEMVVLEGHPSVVLREESTRAELLVVGSRGHGEFVGILIGSVSEFLATHASCPLVIVRYAAT